MSQSSVTVSRFEPDGPNMIHVEHFTGALLLSDDEANHLRALLDAQLGDMPRISAGDPELADGTPLRTWLRGEE